MAPHYNSKAMKIAVVVDGEGGFQMACPHLSSSRKGGRWSEREQEQMGESGRWSEREQEQERKGERTYQKIRGRLRRGVVFVVPAGHPFSVFASNNQNLQIVCFEANAFGNTKYLLAGKYTRLYNHLIVHFLGQIINWVSSSFSLMNFSFLSGLISGSCSTKIPNLS